MPTATFSKVNSAALYIVVLALTKLSFTRRKTVADRSTSVRIPSRSDEASTNEAPEIATSLPDPMATATSAAASAWVAV